MNTLLLSEKELEYGSYLEPIAFVVPDKIKSYKKAIKWLKKRPDFLPTIFTKSCQAVYNDETGDIPVLSVEDVTDMSIENNRFHIDFEQDEYIYEVNFSMEFFEIYNV
jgi:hypothetical protein